MTIKSSCSRRKFLRLCAASALALWSAQPLHALAAVARPSHPQEAAAAAGKEIPIMPGFDAACLRQLITADSRTSRTIVWHSTDPQADAQVIWRRLGKTEQHIVQPVSVPFSDDGQTCYIHTARLQELLPAHHYEYRITAAGTGSRWYPLDTPRPGSFKALIFPDSQCGNEYTTWQDLAQNAAARNPDAAFFINMGDLVDNGESSYQWNAWFDALRGIRENLPFAPVMGNHSTYTLEWKVRLPSPWLHYFPVPENHSQQFPGYYYSFDWGDVHFSVLNTQWGELDPLRPGILAEQKAWLPADIRASSARWKIVLMHKDVVNYENLSSIEPLADIDPVGRELMPLFDELGIDVVLTAHQHTYRRLNHIFNFEPADHGPFYIDTGVAGDVRYDVPVDPRLDRKVLPQPEVDNYLTLEASAHTLHFKCFQPDGSLADEAVLNK